MSAQACHSGAGGHLTGHPGFFCEGGWTVKELASEGERIKAYRLRHRVFSQELRWVPKTENGLEIDEYDDDAIFLGVFNGGHELTAFLRLIPAYKSFMLEKTFAFLVGSSSLIRKARDTAEISRLCIERAARNAIVNGSFGFRRPIALLYKGVYRWCLGNNIRFLYFVADQKMFRLLRKNGFPCEVVGGPGVMPDGGTAVAAMMDWREFEELNTRTNPDVVQWFSQCRSDHAPWQPRRPASCR